ncbi:MAG: hypothetical protein AAB512_04340 [Patescibacteria group bacterium]
MKEAKSERDRETEKKKESTTFSKFLSDPLIASALLVFAFIALMFSLTEFLKARGF